MSLAPLRYDAQPQLGSTYILEDDNATDIARLMNQSSLLAEISDGPFPETLDLSGVTHVLDLGCGPGGWVLEVAERSPAIEVTGVDLSSAMVEYASAHAQVRYVDNAHFEVMDVTKPLAFPDQSFDLVHGRFLSSFLKRDAWSEVMAECQRVLRPGGIVLLTEGELATTTSAACEQFSWMVAQALKLAGRTFSPMGDTLCVTPQLGYFLRLAGCHHIQHHALLIDASVEGAQRGLFENNMALLSLLEPLLLTQQVTTPHELEELRMQIRIDVLKEEFQAIWPLFSVWGRTPGDAPQQEEAV